MKKKISFNKFFKPKKIDLKKLQKKQDNSLDRLFPELFKDGKRIKENKK